MKITERILMQLTVTGMYILLVGCIPSPSIINKIVKISPNLIDPINLPKLKGHYWEKVPHETTDNELKLRSLDVINLYYTIINKNLELEAARELNTT
jgi:hypothetical protein|tara:strand:+ start:250 stop:540 length:291 start_codon:yes stop_codon:yes gene_type:complete